MRIEKLSVNTVVHRIQTVNNRMEIDEPVEGWLSLRTRTQYPNNPTIEECRTLFEIIAPALTIRQGRSIDTPK
eukprot:UN28532